MTDQLMNPNLDKEKLSTEGIGKTPTEVMDLSLKSWLENLEKMTQVDKIESNTLNTSQAVPTTSPDLTNISSVMPIEKPDFTEITPVNDQMQDFEDSSTTIANLATTAPSTSFSTNSPDSAPFVAPQLATWGKSVEPIKLEANPLEVTKSFTNEIEPKNTIVSSEFSLPTSSQPEVSNPTPAIITPETLSELKSENSLDLNINANETKVTELGTTLPSSSDNLVQTESKSKKMILSVVTIVGIILLAGIASVFYSNLQKESALNPDVNQNTEIPENTDITDIGTGEGIKTYSNNTAKYDIDYPEDWTLYPADTGVQGETSFLSSSLLASDPTNIRTVVVPQDQVAIAISLIASDKPSSQDLQEYLNSNATLFEIAGITQASVASIPAYQASSTKEEVLYYYFERKNIEFSDVFSIAIKPGSYPDSFAKDIETILASFKFESPQPLLDNESNLNESDSLNDVNAEITKGGITPSSVQFKPEKLYANGSDRYQIKVPSDWVDMGLYNLDSRLTKKFESADKKIALQLGYADVTGINLGDKWSTVNQLAVHKIIKDTTLTFYIPNGQKTFSVQFTFVSDEELNFYENSCEGLINTLELK